MNIKKKRMKICILASMSMLFVLFACTDDGWLGNTTTPPSGKNEQLTASIARQWYESNYTPVVATRVSEEKEQLIKPDWEKAKEHNRQRYEVVETPILSQGMRLMMDNETAQHWMPGQKSSFVRNTTKMVVMRDKKTGDTRSFIMEFIGSYNYLRKTKSMGRNSYLYREPDFDGAVMFYEVDGTFINGWKYADGKIVATIALSLGEELQTSDELPDTRGMVEECWDNSYTLSYNVCSTYSWEVFTEYGSEYHEEEDCHLEFETVTTRECQMVDDGNNESDDNWWENDYPPGGAGNGQQTIVNNSKSPAENIVDKIYGSNSGLSTSDKNKLINAIAELLQTPALNRLLRDLSYRNLSIKFVYDNNISLAHFDAKNGKIAFRDSNCITPHALCEELVHALQYYGFYGSYMTNNIRNYEFEAKLFQDISCVVSGGLCPSITIMGMDSNDQFNMLYNQFMNTFIDDPNTQFTVELEDIYYQMGKLWNQYPGTFDDSISPQLLKQYFND